MSTSDQLINAFIDESRELLADLEGQLLDLEDDPTDRNKLDAVFRVMHTIKGSAGMVGFDVVNQFTHQVEDAFDLIRKGERLFDSETADITLLARDVILQLLERNEDVDQELQDVMTKVLQGLQAAPIDEKEAEAEITEEEEGLNHYRIIFQPGEDIFLRGINPKKILEELLLAGECTVSTHFDKLPALEDLNPEKSYLYWQILLTTEFNLPKLRNIFQFVESESLIEISQLDSHVGHEMTKLGDILKSQGLISDEDLNEALNQQKRLGEVLVEKNKVSHQELHNALKEQEHMKKQEMKIQSQSVASSIRVSTEKLDQFVDLVGELVTLQAQLDQTSRRVADMELQGVSERLQSLIEDLRDTALGIRMVPIGDSFNGFRRLVRDLSNQLSKSVQLIISGGDTELDKTVIDRLHDPLMHIIRNSLDHGIESAEKRRAAGKSKEGVIKLSARHAGGNVMISIEDDGGGLDKDRILEKAVERGLVSSDAKLRDEEIYKLIFHSGFSTAQTVSKVSGRGVGMDVVKKEMDALGGHISLESQLGEYTKVNFTLPLTLAIIDGLLVKIQDDHYVLPLAAVESCLELNEAQTEGNENAGEGDIIYYRENFLPYINLRDFLDYSGDRPEREQLVVIRTEDSFYGLVVDQVIGDHQTVIKNLGRLFRSSRAYSGATIMGNGDVALILNISTLAQMSKRSSNQEVAN